MYLSSSGKGIFADVVAKVLMGLEERNSSLILESSECAARAGYSWSEIMIAQIPSERAYAWKVCSGNGARWAGKRPLAFMRWSLVQN